MATPVNSRGSAILSIHAVVIDMEQNSQQKPESIVNSPVPVKACTFKDIVQWASNRRLWSPSSCLINDSHLASLVKCESLMCLTLENCAGITKASLLALSDLKQLKELNLLGFTLSPPLLTSFSPEYSAAIAQLGVIINKCASVVKLKLQLLQPKKEPIQGFYSDALEDQTPMRAVPLIAQLGLKKDLISFCLYYIGNEVRDLPSVAKFIAERPRLIRLTLGNPYFEAMQRSFAPHDFELARAPAERHRTAITLLTDIEAHIKRSASSYKQGDKTINPVHSEPISAKLEVLDKISPSYRQLIYHHAKQTACGFCHPASAQHSGEAFFLNQNGLCIGSDVTVDFQIKQEYILAAVRRELQELIDLRSDGKPATERPEKKAS